MGAVILIWTMTLLFFLLAIRTAKKGEIFFGTVKGQDLKSKKEESTYWLLLIMYSIVALACLLAAIKMSFFS